MTGYVTSSERDTFANCSPPEPPDGTIHHRKRDESA